MMPENFVNGVKKALLDLEEEVFSAIAKDNFNELSSLIRDHGLEPDQELNILGEHEVQLGSLKFELDYSSRLDRTTIWYCPAVPEGDEPKPPVIIGWFWGEYYLTWDTASSLKQIRYEINCWLRTNPAL